MIGGSNERSEVSPETRRRAFLKMVYEMGYHDGLHMGAPIPGRYADDEEAGMRYRIGARIGKRERQRTRHEV